VPHHPAHRTPYREVSVSMVCETLAFGSAILNCSMHQKNALYKIPEMKKLLSFFFLRKERRGIYLFTAALTTRVTFPHGGSVVGTLTRDLFVLLFAPTREAWQTKVACRKSQQTTPMTEGADKGVHKINKKNMGQMIKIICKKR
jgi:hypothetical protein